jgi:hypothetical protein
MRAISTTLGDPRDLSGKPDAAVVLWIIADHSSGIADIPEIMGVVADAIENLERDAVLIVY